MNRFETLRRSSHSAWALLAAVALAIGLRLLVAQVFADQLRSDPDAYVALAESLARTGVFGLPQADEMVQPTAFRPPLFPWLLSWFVVDGQLPPVAIALFQTVCGVVLVLCAWHIARLLVLPPLVPALLAAIDPILLMQSAQPMTEPAAAAAAALLWLGWLWLFGRTPTFSIPVAGGVLALGLLMGLCILLRPTYAILILALLGYAVLARFQHPAHWWQIGLVGVGVVTVVGSWTYRNERALGRPVWATTHGGYTLLLANNPVHYSQLGISSIWRAWDSKPFFERWQQRWSGDPTTGEFWSEPMPDELVPDENRGELAEDDLAYAAARATIDRAPAAFVASCLIRVARLWTPLPLDTSDRSHIMRALVAIYYVLLYGLAIFGLWRLRWHRLLSPRWVPAILLIAALTIVHAVYWSNMRMRAPATVCLGIFAASAVRRTS